MYLTLFAVVYSLPLWPLFSKCLGTDCKKPSNRKPNAKVEMSYPAFDLPVGSGHRDGLQVSEIDLDEEPSNVLKAPKELLPVSFQPKYLGF